jgi:hypothetical protein
MRPASMWNDGGGPGRIGALARANRRTIRDVGVAPQLRERNWLWRSFKAEQYKTQDGKGMDTNGNASVQDAHSTPAP